ncbi:MAG: UvrD-helicase domain-containing protein [Pseudomonadota bacterium]
MTDSMSALADNEVDNGADTCIAAALSLEHPQSFILYAGAGSGKTRSLKNALDHIREKFGESLKRRGRQVGVITYTNAARDEIMRRVEFDTLFHVATIHSFAWALIEDHTEDIRNWLASCLPEDIAKIEDEQDRGRIGRASEERARKIEAKKKRLQMLPTIKKFVYNPDGDNFTKDSLSHSEVINIAADFIGNKVALKHIIISRYPFLLIDESQDTLLPFIDAILAFEDDNHENFALGLFGDMMQRIYTHGKPGLAEAIPKDRWKHPEKIMNHRSRERIVRLANNIRADDDGWKQKARSDKTGGFAFVYALPADTADKPGTEERIRADLAIRTGDPNWNDLASVKMLTLEHHMAASRLGFLEMFDAIDKVSIYRTSFRDGTLPSIRLFSERILPLIDAHSSGDRFSVMAVLKAHSPLVSKQALFESGEKSKEQLKAAQTAVDHLNNLFSNGNEPTFGEVLDSVAASRLFPIPEVLQPYTVRGEFADLLDLLDLGDLEDEISQAWTTFLKVPFSQIRRYKEYVQGLAPFDTHQGVKGLQFPRVMVIADDTSNRFRASASYEKLFGAKPPSANDKKNEAEGRETQIEKTRRLLYVTCTRAEESLALVAYTENPNAVAKTLVSSGWFENEEVVTAV